LPSAEGGAFYRHRVMLEVEGDFAGILATLRALEALPWPIRWDALRYEVVLHPFARATLRFHTLGPRAEWVGA
ncbi:MAG TPA: hypothetical protein VMT18_02485, partial [Planctomycetota bacterium]|nr:hypothetical protein [Planctomycetota bacterium]